MQRLGEKLQWWSVAVAVTTLPGAWSQSGPQLTVQRQAGQVRIQWTPEARAIGEGVMVFPNYRLEGTSTFGEWETVQSVAGRTGEPVSVTRAFNEAPWRFFRVLVDFSLEGVQLEGVDLRGADLRGEPAGGQPPGGQPPGSEPRGR